MNKNLYSFLLVLTVLVFNTIACSHSRPITADAGLTEETTSEESAEVGSVSEGAEAPAAEDLVGSAEGESALEATASNEEKPSSDPLLAGMENPSSPEDTLQVAQASITETATDNNVLPMQNSESTVSFSESNVSPTEASSFGAVSAPKEKKVRPVKKPAVNKTENVVAPEAPKAEVKPENSSPVAQKEVAPPVASNIDDPFADELNAPIPEHEKPKLASTEIGSFIERHAFLVTLCAVGFVFGLFIFMRRNRDQDDHHLSV